MVSRRRSPLALIAASLAAGSSCGSVLLAQVEVGNATANAACAAVISQVFADSGFVPVSSMLRGPPMLFAPRTTGPLTFSMTLGWAIGVSFTAGGGEVCGFRLQALSPEPDCMPAACLAPGPPRALPLDPEDRACYGLTPTCPLSVTGGSAYTAVLIEMNRRIRAAMSASGHARSGSNHARSGSDHARLE